MENRTIKGSFLIALLITLGGIGTGCVFHLGNPQAIKSTPTEIHYCRPIPDGFTESDLIGNWIGKYFGNVDELIIRADGTYKQVYSSDTLKFESEWQKWKLEYAADDTVRLHLSGMRRCDDTDSVCNLPGGGLGGTMAINPCTYQYITYTDEVILFVSGFDKKVPRGIVLWQAKIAGSDWNFAYQLQSK
jgi:hypothetical protein